MFVFVGAGNIEDFARLFTAWVQAKGATDQTWRLSLEGQVSAACKLANATPLASKTTMRIGGLAAYYAEPSNLTDLRALIDNAKDALARFLSRSWVERGSQIKASMVW